MNTLKAFAENVKKTDATWAYPAYAEKDLGTLPQQLHDEMNSRADAWVRWNKWNIVPGLLEKAGTDVEDPWLAQDIAVVMENQRLINESCQDSGDVAQFKRLSIPLVARTITTTTLLRKLCNHWTLLRSDGHVYWRDGGRLLVGKKVNAVTRKFGTVWRYEVQQNLRARHNVEREQQLLEQFAASLSDEIVLDAVDSMWSCAAYSTLCSANRLYSNITSMMNAVHSEIGHHPNWVYTSPQIAALLGFKLSEPSGTTHYGTVDIAEGRAVEVYSNPAMQKHKLLMGYKGNDFFDGGFTYVSYIPYTQSPVILDMETFQPIKGMMTRYAKALRPSTGNAYYAKLRVKGVP